MTGYVKLFQSILGSSIWAGSDSDLRVWIAILALKDRKHEVRISPPGLATIARVSLEACRGALDKFAAPDPDSTSKDFEGRKIEALEGGGFVVLNGAKYAAMLSLEERREYQRDKQREYRARKKGNPTVGPAAAAAAAAARKAALLAQEEQAKAAVEFQEQVEGQPEPSWEDGEAE